MLITQGPRGDLINASNLPAHINCMHTILDRENNKIRIFERQYLLSGPSTYSPKTPSNKGLAMSSSYRTYIELHHNTGPSPRYFPSKNSLRSNKFCFPMRRPLSNKFCIPDQEEMKQTTSNIKNKKVRVN